VLVNATAVQTLGAKLENSNIPLGPGNLKVIFR